mgnify:CR=1 FL=1
MNFRQKTLSRTITRAMGTSVSSLAASLIMVPAAHAQTDDNVQLASGKRIIEEVTVTASRRTESMQDVPIAIQALTSETLDQLGIGDFEDYVGELPGVTLAGQGPGRNEVFIRGVSAGRGAVRISGLGQEPNVAIYLDDAPVTTGGRNVDIYATDLDRIEVLKGPQGTLFGASSQTGTVRMITNKPVLNEVEGGGKFSTALTRSGDPSDSVEGHINIPVIQDRLALRFAGYNVTKGGYIDNVSGTKQIPLTNPTLEAAGAVPETRQEITNQNVAEEDFNQTTIRGLRSSLYYEVNPDWNVLLQHTNQTQETDGIFEIQPELSESGPHSKFSTQTFSPDRGDDDLDHTSWTVNGRIDRLDELEVVYTGSYMDREFEGTQDYSGYANTGPFIPYYICTPGYDECFSPQLFVDQFFGVERQIHEFRLATNAANPWRIIAGVYYEDTETTERGDFTYPGSIPAGFARNQPVPGATSSNPNLRGPGVTFFNDFIRDREEVSFFGEFSYDILPNLTATFGAREYSIEIALAGNSSFGSRAENNTSGINVDEVLEGRSPTSLSDTIFKGNLDWDVTPQIKLFATFSEGFRAGGFNRNGTGTTNEDIPFFFESDTVTNHEIGWKTQFLDGSLQFNGAAFFIDYEDIQTQVLDFSISNVSFLDNVADAEIYGAEFDLSWFPTNEISTYLTVSYNETELTSVPETVVNLAPVGSELPLAPELQLNWRGRYDTQITDTLNGFAQVSVKYTDESFSDLVAEKRFLMDSYTQVDLSAGVSRDNWKAKLYVDNVDNTFGTVFETNEDDIFRQRPIRPRTIGVEFAYDF